MRLLDRGAEFGATTGRPRRCGWFDAALVRQAVRVNGVTRWGAGWDTSVLTASVHAVMAAVNRCEQASS